jgi:hypothetical protein
LFYFPSREREFGKRKSPINYATSHPEDKCRKAPGSHGITQHPGLSYKTPKTHRLASCCISSTDHTAPFMETKENLPATYHEPVSFAHAPTPVLAPIHIQCLHISYVSFLFYF